MRQSREQVQELYRSGVDAIASVTAGFTDEDWERPACGVWTGRQTVVHLGCVADWYHDWLDRSVAGDQTRPFAQSEIDQRTERDVQLSAHLSGPYAIERFQARANEYLARTTINWDLPYGYPFGVVTTGLHCGVAATEWHLHAWDLANSAGVSYTPPDPKSLFIAAGSCVAAGKGVVGGALLKMAVPLAARRSPWKTLLERSGRQASGI